MSCKKNGPRMVEGVIRECLGEGKYRVELSPEHCIIVEASATIKVRLALIQVGDIVRCEFSPIERGRARIVAQIRNEAGS